jgi:glucose-1-phosphate adenylyltransferase
MNSVLSIILGGGRGTRLFPLTMHRCKPAVPIGGKYRLIDIPISNCLNSGIRQIYVLTQFLSASLHSHIARTYRLDDFGGGFVDILAAEQGVTNLDWYQGTADAVRKQLDMFDRPGCEHVLILAGDHLYKMDYRDMLQTHLEQRADITVAVLPTSREAAPQLGILQIDDQGMVCEFQEKPQTAELLDTLGAPGPVLERLGATDPGRPYLASMGIYLFRREVLTQLLRESDHVDFGHDLIPEAIGHRRVAAHYFGGYWEDVGTMSAYFRTHLMLSEQPHASFLFYGTGPTRIFSRGRFLPASRCMGARIDHSTVADGCVLYEGCNITHSVLGLRSIVRAGTSLRDTIVNGADYYEKQTVGENPASTPPLLGIGRNCNITRAILDKNVRIGDDVTIHDASQRPDTDGPNFCIRDGIVIIPKNAVLEPGTII